MGRVHHCIRKGNGFGSEQEMEMVARDASEGRDNKASGRVHRVGRMACTLNTGMQGVRREG